MKIKYSVLTAAIFTAMIGVTGCSSSSDGTTTASANVTGRITGFGSVYVDGVEYETAADTDITVDGVASQDSDLRVGMLVTLTGSDNGKNGNATSITFNDNLEGVVTQTVADGGLIVMGQAISVDNSTNLDGFALIDDLAIGDKVEISGYPDGNGGILATYIELEGTYTPGDDIEVKGTVSAHNSTAMTFMLGAMEVNYSNADISDAAGLDDGVYVEVKSTSAPDATTGILAASKVELENGGEYGVHGDDGEELEIEGLITAIDANTITVNGQTFEVPAGIDISALTVGDMIDIDIHVVGGDLVVNKVESEDFDDDVAGKFEIKAQVTATNTVENTITLGGITISVDPSKTIMLDHADMPLQFFNLGSIVEGTDRVKIEAIPNPAGDGYIALSIERKTSTSTTVELEGIVSIDATSGEMRIAGILLGINTNPVFVAAGAVDGSEIHANGELDVDGNFVVTAIELDD